jgi:hypothetical protein
VGDWATFNGTTWQRVEGGAAGNFTDISVSGTATLSGLTASTALALNASKQVVSVTNTGTGDNVLATSPTLVAPNLGTPASGVVTNLTGTASININGTVGATTANTGAFTTLTTTGNVTLGDASTDTVQVNGYMGVGGAGGSTSSIIVQGNALTSTSQTAVTAVISGNSAATTRVRGFAAGLGTTASAFTVTDLANFWASDASKGAGSTITNQHGLYISDQSAGTNNYGITSLVSSGTNKWNIYASGTAANYFAGNVQFAAGSAAAPALTRFGDTNTGIFFPAADTIAFSEGGAEAMRIDSAGNVGIGTSAPGALLEVRSPQAATGGIIRIANTAGGLTTDSPIGALDFYNNDTSSDGPQIAAALRGLCATANGAGGVLALYTATGTTGSEDAPPIERMRINSNGNVGIGTSAPTHVLEVQSDTSTNLLNLRANSAATGGSAAGLSITAASNLININTSTASDDIAFTNQGTERMRIDSAGNVGIGTSSPASTAKLHIVGPNVAFGSEGGLLVESSSTGADTGGQISFENAGGPRASISGRQQGPASASGFLQFGVANPSGDIQERMRIDSAGNVGIGTSSPAFGIDLVANSGNIRTTDNTTDATNKFGRLILRHYTNAEEDAYLVGGLTTSTTNEVFIGGGSGALNQATDIKFFTAANTTTTGSTERMRITSAGNVGIGTSSPSASAILDAQSTTKGVRMPNMTTTQKNAIASPAAGLMVFDTTLAKLCVYSGAAWETITSI